jgi:acyl carrier protein
MAADDSRKEALNISSGNNSAAGAPAQRDAYTAEELQDWLVTHLAEELGVDPQEIDVREPLASYGLRSVAAVSLSGDLEALLGCKLSTTLLWEYSTIESLAGYLAEEYPRR